MSLKLQRKPRLILTASGLALALTACTGYRPARWTELASNQFSSVSVEEALYVQPRSQHFFVHFRLFNRLPRVVGTDLSGEWFDGPPHTTAWQIRDEASPDLKEWWWPPVFSIVNHQQFHERKLLTDFKTGKAIIIPANGYIDYYAENKYGASDEVRRGFDDTSLWIRAKSSLPHANASLSLGLYIIGKVYLTDGRFAEYCLPKTRTVAIPYPVPWKWVPQKAHLIQIE